MGSNITSALLALLAFAIFATHDVIVKILGADYSPIQIIVFSVLFAFPWVPLAPASSLLDRLSHIRDDPHGCVRLLRFLDAAACAGLCDPICDAFVDHNSRYSDSWGDG